MPEIERLQGQIPLEMAGLRLDVALAEIFSQYSRARLQGWIRAGQVRVNDQEWLQPKAKVQGGEMVDVHAVLELEELHQAEAIPLAIVYEDENLIVVNKAIGMVAHPAVGNRQGTLLNALLHHAPELHNVPRAGIVHRLDKETSGLLVIARTLVAQNSLVEQLQAREFGREYEAIVIGPMISGGTVDAPIGRHHSDRKRMAVSESGKEAITHYRLAERFRDYTHLRVRLETGRTHQIRVHMAHIRHPLVGDPVYGGRLRIPKQSSEELNNALRGFRRQALHAARLGLRHPKTDEWMEWDVPIPADMQTLIEILRRENRAE